MVKTTKRKMQTEKGSVLIAVLIISSIMIILGSTLIYVLLSETKTNEAMEIKETASYLAYSGIEHGIAIIVSTQVGATPVKPSGSIKTYENGDIHYEYEIPELTANHIKAVGRIIKNGATIKEITMAADIDASGNVIITKQ